MGMPGRHDRLVVTDMKDIEELLCIIHDEFFDVDDIKYDPSTKNFDIPFFRAYRDKDAKIVKKSLFSTVYEVPAWGCTLRIGNVEDYTLVDKQKMGYYDFNVIKYNQSKNRVTVVTSIPLELYMTVSDLHLEYFESGIQRRAHIKEFWLGQSGPHLLPE